MNTFEKFVIAHLIADFLLQNNWMALNKTRKLGLPIIVHTVIYGLTMGAMFQNVLIIVPVACMHGIVDIFGLGNVWLRLIGGRSFESIDKVHEQYEPMSVGQREVPPRRDAVIYISFTAVVYVVVDFLIHFLTTYPALIAMLKYWSSE